jgi:hypothetical protein
MAKALSIVDDNVNIDGIGSMCINCPECLAFHFKKVKIEICCYNCKVASEHVSHHVIHLMHNELVMGINPSLKDFLNLLENLIKGLHYKYG